MCMSKVRVLNVDIDNVTMEEAVAGIDDMVQKRIPSYVVTPNLDHIVTLEKDAYFREVYAHADMVLADGKPLLWIAKWQKTPLKQKVSGSDLFPKVAELAERKGYKMFFLGAAEGVAQKAADVLHDIYPGLQVVECYAPPYGFDKDKDKLQEIISMIRKAKPDILIVGLGAPKQEKFMYRYLHKLEVPVSLGLGASFDFIAGVKKRAPHWMSEHGMEWLYRMVQEPRRLVGRYIKDGFLLLPLMVKYRRNRKQYEDIN